MVYGPSETPSPGKHGCGVIQHKIKHHKYPRRPFDVRRMLSDGWHFDIYPVR